MSTVGFTLWQKRTTCPSCGAKVVVPDEGLTMFCQFCGHQMPVPDIERRQRNMRKEEKDHNNRNPENRTTVTTPTRRRGVGPGTLLLGALIAVPLYVTGVFDWVSEPLFGDDGQSRMGPALERMRQLGFAFPLPASRERTLGPREVYLPFERPGCYALVLGAGQPLAKVQLVDPQGRVVGRHDTLRTHETLVHCPRVQGVFKAYVELDRPGRFTWALGHADEGVAVPQELLMQTIVQPYEPETPVASDSKKTKKARMSRSNARRPSRTKRTRGPSSEAEKRGRGRAGTGTHEPVPSPGELEDLDPEIRRALEREGRALEETAEP